MCNAGKIPTVLLETLFLSHPTITETPMVGIIIETEDTTKSFAKRILKTSIAPNKGCAHGEDRQDSKEIKKFNSN